MDDQTDPVAQLLQQEQSDQDAAQRVVGEHAVTQEQQGYQAQIDQQRQQAQPATRDWFRTGDVLKGAWNGVAHAGAELAVSVDELMTRVTGHSDTDSFLGTTHVQEAQYWRSKADAL
jgi:hypothetical protein